MSITDLITRKDRGVSTKTNMEDPFSLFHREMNRLFDDFFTDFSVAPSSWSALNEQKGVFSPKVNVSETDKDIRISADLPGMDKEDISVELEDNAVVISGERKEEHEEKNEKWHRIEHSYGSFRRMIQLPAGVDASKATADFKKGVLNVSLPKVKPESAKRKTIDIKAE